MNLKTLYNILLTLSGLFTFQSTSLLYAPFLSKKDNYDVFGQYQFFISTYLFFILLAKMVIAEKISFSLTEKTNWNIIYPKKKIILYCP